MVDIAFPIEFVVFGTPVSQQAKRKAALAEWKERVKKASRPTLPEGHFASQAAMSVTLHYFPLERAGGDIDNIVKPILDALARHIYLDDDQVDRLLVQRFDPDADPPFRMESALHRQARSGSRPALYIRVSDDPFEDLAR